MSRPWKLATTLLSILLMGIIVGLYYSGYIRFNYPDPKRFPVTGIDISHHQGMIDWDRLAAENLSFVYMKATEGGDFKDQNFHDNWLQAKNHGLTRGAYHFFTFCKPGAIQADNFIATVPVEPDTLPPMIDVEYSGNCANRPNKDSLHQELQELSDKIRQHFGQSPILYVTYESYNQYFLGRSENYPIWIRDIYTFPRLPDQGRWLFWQYANRGRQRGIETFVDLDVFNGDRHSFAGLMRK